MVRLHLGQLRAALGYLTRLPGGQTERVAGDLSLAVVLAAGLLGLASVLAGWLCRWLAGPVAGGLVAGLLLPPAVWWATRARGLQALYAAVSGGRGGSERSEEFSLRLVGFQAVLLLKLICVGLLVGAGGALWLLVAWLLAGGTLADEWSHHARQARAGAVCWLVAAAGCVAIGGLLGQFVVTLLLAALCWLALPVVRRWLPLRLRLSAATLSWLLVEATEMVVLVLAVLVVFAR